MAGGEHPSRPRANCLAALAVGKSTLIAALLATAAARASLAEEAALTVTGNRRVDADAIKSHFHRMPGGEADPRALDQALKELYATGAFEDVRIDRAGGHLVVRVVEAPVIGRVAFEGNRAFKDGDLAKATAPNLPLTRSAVQADVARITELYRHKGRYAAQVTAKSIPRGEGSVDLVFEISEGAKTVIRRIAFVGNRTFSEQRLKALVTTAESSWLAFLKGVPDIYEPERVNADAERVRAFYAKNGFADARVVSAVPSYESGLAGIVLCFTIEEGERYLVRAVDVESHIAAVDGVLLKPLVHIAAGETFNGEAVENARRDLLTALGKSGYPFVSVRPRLARDARANAVDVVFVLDDGPHRYIERIVVHGNARTREEVIRRELDLAEGDPLNQARIERAEHRLKALGLFKSVAMSTKEGSATDRVVLAVDVDEQLTGDYHLSGGYSSAEGLVGEVSVSEMNFLGRGQFVKVSATLGQYVRGGALAFVEPYLIGNRVSLGADIFYRESLTNSYQSYGSLAYGGDIKVAAPLSDNLSAGVRYSLINQSLSLAPSLMDCSPANPPPACFANGEASAAVKQAALNGPLWISSIGPTLTWSTLDNPRNPTDGMRADLKSDIAGLGGGAGFFKETGDVRYYKSLGNDVVAVTHVQGGTVSPYGGQSLPLLSSFFGGPQLVRGFAPNGFGPRDLTPGTTMDNIGGSSYWATSAQLEAPLPGLPPQAALKGAIFADAGSLWGYRGPSSFPGLSQSFTPADSSQVRASVGASLIWDSPLGPLHVDYALPVSKTNYDVTQRLSFGAGGF
jgi:outer membrane protein insertion porin family